MMAFLPEAMVPVAAAALRGLLAGAAVGGGLWLLRLRNVVAQKAAWTLVLAGALLMPLIAPWLVPWMQRQSWFPSWLPNGASIAAQAKTAFTRAEFRAEIWMMSLRAQRETPAVEPVRTDSQITVSETPAPSYSDAAPIAPLVEQSSTPAELAGPLGPQYPPHALENYAGQATTTARSAAADALWALYLVVALALLARLFYGLGAAIYLWQAGEPISLDSTPLPVRKHAEIISPVTIGSGILLPADYLEWDEGKLSIVLAHESSHVRQRDFYLQLAAGLYAAIFWFSPLGWWLKSKLSELSEAISDRAAVAHAPSRASYARILLEFASQSHTSTFETNLGVAMARTTRITQRIEWLLNETSFRQAFAGGRLRILAAVILAPLAVFAATALVRVEAKAQVTNGVTGGVSGGVSGGIQQAAPTQGPASAPQSTQAPATGVSRPDNAPITVPPAPAAPDIAPVAVPAPVATPAPAPLAVPAPEAVPPVPLVSLDQKVFVDTIHPVVRVNAKAFANVDTTAFGRSYAYAYANSGQENGNSYAFITKDGQHVRFLGDYHSGTIDKARQQAHGDFLWFSRDGKQYIVDDPEVVARIHSIYQPMEQLGKQMREIGKQEKADADAERQEIAAEMAASGFNKEDFDKQMAEIRANEPEFKKEMAELSAQMATMKPVKAAPIDQKQLDDLKQQMAQLQATQPDFNAKLSELISKMVKLQMPKIEPLDETKMAELNERMAEISRKFADDQARIADKRANYAKIYDKQNAEAYKKLADKMSKIGTEEGKLGGEMGRMATDADRQIKSIIDESLKDGKARPVQ
jgi:beta-lactamase regulating signal transducer with metallopeptidase domain